MRRARPTAALLLALAAAPLAAAPADPVGPPPPAVVVRVKPVDELLADVKAVAAAADAPAVTADDVRARLAALLGDDWEKAIDTSKPLGMVGTPDADWLKSTAVFLVPVKDEKAALKLIDRFEPKESGGVHTFVPGDSPVPLHLKFVGGYAAVSVLHSTALEKGRLPVPADVLKADKPAGWLSVTVDGDRVTPALREVGLKQIAELSRLKLPGEGGQGENPLFPVYKQAGGELAALVTRDARKASLDIDFDRKTGEASVGFTLTPRPQTDLADRLAGNAKVTSKTAGVLRDDDAARYAWSVTYPEAIQRGGLEALRPLLDPAATPNAGTRAGLKLGLAYNEARDGTDDYAFALRGPDKDGRFTLVLAHALKHPAKLEKAVRAMPDDLPEGMRGPLKGLKLADKADANGLRLHSFTLPEETPNLEAVRKAFGDGPVLIGEYPGLVLAAYGPGAEAAVKEGKSLKPVPASLSRVEADPAAVAALLKHFGVEAKGDKGRLKLFVMDAEGGDRLHVRMTTDVLGVLRTAKMARPE